MSYVYKHMIVTHIDLTWRGLTSRGVYMTLLFYTIMNIIIVVMIIIYHTTPLQFLKRRSQQFSENQNIKIIKPMCCALFMYQWYVLFTLHFLCFGDIGVNFLYECCLFNGSSSWWFQPI